MGNKSLSNSLIEWFYKNARQMPWRVIGKAHGNPYQVWISEIMLQQTTVKTVESYFTKWIERFPDIQSLANADIEEVLLYWQGLGYYTRARKLHECAKVLIEKYNGHFPTDRKELLKLPGIGPYSASSILAFAFNAPETVVDGNVIRVLARFYGIETPVTKDEIFALAEKLTPDDKPADYASAIMDLGATICTPLSSKCLLCPWQNKCVAFKKGLVDKIPVIQKPEKKVFVGYVYLIQNDKGAYFIQKRMEKGLLHGLYEFPWTRDKKHLFHMDDMVEGQQKITHTFTHFHLTLTPIFIKCNQMDKEHGHFVSINDFKEYPFSTLMKKVIRILPD